MSGIYTIYIMYIDPEKFGRIEKTVLALIIFICNI